MAWRPHRRGIFGDCKCTWEKSTSNAGADVARMKNARRESASRVPVAAKDAMNEALRDWVTNVRTTYYCVGALPAPPPDARRAAGDRQRARRSAAQLGRFPTPSLRASAAGSVSGIPPFWAIRRRSTASEARPPGTSTRRRSRSGWASSANPYVSQRRRAARKRSSAGLASRRRARTSYLRTQGARRTSGHRRPGSKR
jgi:hypothetical protein